MPERDVPVVDLTQPITLTFEQLQALLGASKPSQQEQIDLLKLQADLTAEANRRALRPENEKHPGISVFSRAGGELANPKGTLPFALTLAGVPENGEALTAIEFDLILAVAASCWSGEYRCTKSDNSAFKVEVQNLRHPDTGHTEKLHIIYATRGHLRHNLPPIAAMCRELIAQGQSKSRAA